MNTLLQPLLIAITLLCTPGASYSQPKKSTTVNQKARIGPLKAKDYDYYVLMPVQATPSANSSSSTYSFTPYYKIIDIRTGAVVTATWPAGDTYLSTNRQRLLNTSGRWPLLTSQIIAFDTAGLVESKTDAQVTLDGTRYGGTFSPNFRSFIFQKENDLWVSDTDLSKGKVSAPRQLTRFGFQNDERIWGWYRDGIALGGRYWVNQKTGDVQDISNPDASAGMLINFNPQTISENPDHYFSADHRFIILSFNPMQQNWGTELIDISNNKFLKLDPNSRSGNYGDSYWLKNKQLIFYDKVSKKGQMFDIYDNGKFVSKQVPVGMFPGENVQMLKYTGYSKIVIPQTLLFGRRCFSPDTSKYIYKGANGICDAIRPGGNDCEWFLYEPLTAKVQLVGKSLAYVAWVDNDHILYCKNGTTSEQGTYVYDLKANSSKKLFSYVIENAYDMQESKSLYNQQSKYLLFGANRTLWRCRADGSDLIELSKGINSDITVRPFLAGVID